MQQEEQVLPENGRDLDKINLKLCRIVEIVIKFNNFNTKATFVVAHLSLFF
jgi:hypothetical protein